MSDNGEPTVAMTDEKLLEEFFRSRDDAASTKEAYRRDLGQFQDSLGDTPLLEADFRDVNAWIRPHLEADDEDEVRAWSRRTARRKRAAVSALFQFAMRAGMMDRNPADPDLVEIKEDETSRPTRIERKYIHQLFETIERKVATVEPRRAKLYALDASVFRFCYNLALRVSEASNLRASHLERRGDELQVLVEKKGRGTNKVYPITGRVREAFERWWRIRADVDVEADSRDFIHVHPWTGKHVTRQRAWHRLQRLADEADLPEDIQQALTPHALRHTQAYWTAEEHGLPAAQSVLDHANISTTSIYVRDDEQARLNALRRASEEDEDG